MEENSAKVKEICDMLLELGEGNIQAGINIVEKSRNNRYHEPIIISNIAMISMRDKIKKYSEIFTFKNYPMSLLISYTVINAETNSDRGYITSIDINTFDNIDYHIISLIEKECNDKNIKIQSIEDIDIFGFNFAKEQYEYNSKIICSFRSFLNQFEDGLVEDDEEAIDAILVSNVKNLQEILRSNLFYPTLTLKYYCFCKDDDGKIYVNDSTDNAIPEIYSYVSNLLSTESGKEWSKEEIYNWAKQSVQFL